jgi:hypothetical protein
MRRVLPAVAALVTAVACTSPRAITIDSSTPGGHGDGEDLDGGGDVVGAAIEAAPAMPDGGTPTIDVSPPSVGDAQSIPILPMDAAQARDIAGPDLIPDSAPSSCAPGELRCAGAALRCDTARWDFEGGLAGWEFRAFPLARGVGIQPSVMAHAGKGSASIPGISVDAAEKTCCAAIRRPLCGAGGVDLRGKFVSAFVFLDGTTLPREALCFIEFEGPGAVMASGTAVPGGDPGHVPSTAAATVGRWFSVTGYFPMVPNPEAWAGGPVSISVGCSFLTTTSDPSVWSGTMYVDDVTIN